MRSFKYLVVAGAAVVLAACSNSSLSPLERNLATQSPMTGDAIQAAIENTSGSLMSYRRDGTHPNRGEVFFKTGTVVLNEVIGKRDLRGTGTWELDVYNDTCLTFDGDLTGEAKCAPEWPAAFGLDDDGTFRHVAVDHPAWHNTDIAETAAFSTADDQLCLTYDTPSNVLAAVEAGEMEMPDPRVACHNVFATNEDGRYVLKRNDGAEEYRVHYLEVHPTLTEEMLQELIS